MINRIRIPRLWKFAGVALFSFTLLLSGIVWGARQLDSLGCAIFSESSSSIFYDLTTHIALEVESQNMFGTSFGTWSPDRRYTVYTESDGDDALTSTLYLRSLEESETPPDPIPLETILWNTRIASGASQGWMSWSPDSSKLVYIWNSPDEQTYITLVNADGSNKRTVPYTPTEGQLNTALLHIIDWSPDSQFLVINEGFSREQGNITYSVWMAGDELKRIPTVLDNLPVVLAEWSPTGHEVAAVIGNMSEPAELLIFSLDTESATYTAPLLDRQVHAIEWSPDGRYITLGIRRSPNFIERWYFDIFTRSGDLLYSGIEGTRPIGVPLPIFPAMWTNDGQSWVYLRERSQNQQTINDLIRLELESGLQQLIGGNLLNEFTGEVFQITDDLFNGSNGTYVYWRPNSERVLLIRQVDDKINVELADAAGGNRTVLVSGADDLILPFSGFSTTIFRSWDNTELTIIWIKGQGENGRAMITKANADGTNIRTYETEYPTIAGVFESNHWLGYRGREDDGTGVIELINTQTGERQIAASGFGMSEGVWNFVLVPDADNIMILVKNSENNQFGRLFIKPRNGEARELLSEVSPASYGGDGFSDMVLLRRSETKTYSVEFITLDGTPVRSIPLNLDLGSQPRMTYDAGCAVGTEV